VTHTGARGHDLDRMRSEMAAESEELMDGDERKDQDKSQAEQSSHSLDRSGYRPRKCRRCGRVATHSNAILVFAMTAIAGDDNV